MAGVRLEFAQFGHFDYFNIYRNPVSTDKESLGQPIGTSSTMYYEDFSTEPNLDYFYRIGVIRDSIEEFSEEIQIYTGAGDKYWDKVKVLMHFNSSSGSTTSFYEQKNAVFLPRLGTTYIEAGGRFNDGIYFGRSGTRAVQIPAHYFKLTNQEFTFNVSLNFTQLNPSTFYDIFGQRGNYSSNQSYAFYFYTGGNKFYFEFSSNGTSMDFVTFDYIPNLNQYHDYQLKRREDSLILEVDGIEVGSASLPPAFTFFESTAHHQLALSAEHVAATTQTHPTWFDEFRVTVGVARPAKVLIEEFKNFI